MPQFVLTSSPVPVGGGKVYEVLMTMTWLSEKLVNQKDPLYRTEREQGPVFIRLAQHRITSFL